MQQYKVPQNIDLEDKIVGPFTMKQFGYLMAGGALVYAIYQVFLPYENGTIYAVILGAPVAILVVCLTFIKVNDRPFEYFILSLFKFIFNPKKMIWQRGYTTNKVIIQTPVPQKATTGDATKKAATLDDIAKQLDMAAGNTGATAPSRAESRDGNNSSDAGRQTPDVNASQSPNDRRRTADENTQIPQPASGNRLQANAPGVQGVSIPAIQPKRSIMRDIFGIRK